MEKQIYYMTADGTAIYADKPDQLETIEISEEQYYELMDGIQNGKEIVVENGKPSLRERFVSEEEKEEEYITYLREKREEICFPVINRGSAWYARLTPEQNEELQAWYQAWLDVTETKVIPETPKWI